jgi:hypothetical protein
MKEWSANVLHRDPNGAIYRSVRAAEDWFGHQQLAVGYHKQLKRHTQDDCEHLQEIATAIQ